MNILFHFRTRGTGAEGVHIAGMARAFRELGHTVVFVSPRSINPTRTAGANPFEKAGGGLAAWLAARAPKLVFELLEIAYNFVAAFRLRALLRQRPFDLIYERHAFFLCATALLARRRRIPLVVEVNELPGDERIRAQPWLLPLARCADKVTFGTARLIVAVSPHLQRKIASFGLPPGKILVLPNGVDDAMISDGADPVDLRDRYGTRETIVVGFAGWFVPWHRLDLLVAAFAPLAVAEPRLRLMLVGNGPLRHALLAQATALGISERVIITGAIPHAQIAAHLSAMDICVVPHSNAYRSPIKLFEYMARGRAVVAARTEPITLVIREEENGLLFAPEDGASMGAQLARLVEDSDLRLRLGQRARQDVAASYTWRHNAETVLSSLAAFSSHV